MDFPSKKDLVDYALSPDFLENRISKDIDEAGRVDLQDACEKYMAGTIEAHDYTEQVLENLADYECEIDSMTIEDFESLRSGNSSFSQETIEMFCSRQEGIEEPVTVISDEHKEAFQKFFDDAHKFWIG
jgi:hypothetical protein